MQSYSLNKDSGTDFGTHYSEYWFQEYHNSELMLSSIVASATSKIAEMFHNFAY